MVNISELEQGPSCSPEFNLNNETRRLSQAYIWLENISAFIEIAKCTCINVHKNSINWTDHSQSIVNIVTKHSWLIDRCDCCEGPVGITVYF